jgi:membrane protein YdbS with pleckstrin-like domain
MSQSQESDVIGETGGFQPLDPRVINLWRVSQGIRSAVWLGLLFFMGTMVALGGAVQLLICGLVFVLAVIVRAGLFFWYPARAYRAWGYRIDGKVLEIHHGIWFRTRQLLPLSRLQHVDLHSGPIERSFGLASLIFHTAGTHQAMIVIPGLDAGVAARLRDQLVAVGGDDGV